MQMLINVNNGKLTRSQHQTICLHAVITTVAINVIANDTKHTEKWFYLWLLKKLFFYMELDEACGPVFIVQLKVNSKGWKVWFLIWGSKKDYSEISHIVICFVGSRSAFVCVCVLLSADLWCYSYTHCSLWI